MEVILSIKPEFANKIFSGDKKFEFRRSLFKNKDITKIIVYASAPVSMVIGEFEIDKILFEELDDLWEKTKEYSGISKDYYLDYFTGKKRGFAVKVKKAKLYAERLNIQEVFGVRAPQSFAYVKG